jgi:dihydroorotate dehydrogenase electron transfer subunit
VKQDSSRASSAAHEGPLFSASVGHLESRSIAGGYARIGVTVDRRLTAPKPGQFVLLRLREGPSLPRPFSVLSAESGRLEFLLKLDGALREALGRAVIGTEIAVRGPYGTPYADRIPRERRFVLAGGGSGIAPLLYFATTHPELTEDVAFGARSGAIRVLLPNVDLAAEDEDGETAESRLRERWKRGAGILACGPEPMLRAVARRYVEAPDTYVSLETKIGCGFGACLGCSIETRSGMQRVCRDGPLFACSEVPWLR